MYWALRTKQEALLGLLWFRLAETGNLFAAFGGGGGVGNGDCKLGELWLAEAVTPPPVILVLLQS